VLATLGPAGQTLVSNASTDFAIRRCYENDDDRRARDDFENSLDAYKEVLHEWNDRLNANLALVFTYFGPKARKHLAVIYKNFAEIGGELDRAGRAALRHEKPPPEFARLAAQFDGSQDPAIAHSGELSDQVYRFVKDVTIQLREGQVGAKAPLVDGDASALVKRPNSIVHGH
jgi:hypothetical protein